MLIALAFTACQKNSIPIAKSQKTEGKNIPPTTIMKKNKIPLNIENNIIIFNNWKQYNNAIEHLSKYNISQLNDWAKLNKFKSYSEKFDSAINALENANSLISLKSIMEKYRDVLTVKRKKDGIHYEPIIYPNPYTSIANNKGLYIIGNKAYRILGEDKLSTSRENINKLLFIHYSDIKNNSINSVVKLKKYAYSFNTSDSQSRTFINDTSSGNNSTNNCTHFCDAQNQTSNRRVYLHVVAYWNSYADVNAVSYYAHIQASAEKKKWWAFNTWLPYKTEIDIEGTNVNGDDFTIMTPWGIKSYDIPHMVSAEDCSSLRLPSPYYGFGPKTWNAYPGPEIYLMQVHLKAWTRGTTKNVFANIEYNY